MPSGPRVQARDAGRWALVVGAGSGLTVLAVHLHARLGTAAAPFIGHYAVRTAPATAAALVVAVVVVAAVARGWHERLAWRWLLPAGWLLASGWAVSLALVEGRGGLAGPMTRPDGYLADVPLVHDDPLRYLRDFVATAASHTPWARQHPPAPVLLLWALGKAGLHDPLGLGLLVTAVGALSVPLVAVAVRSLCHEPAARRVLPLLVVAPYAVWVAVSMDAVTMTLGAAALAAGVLASEHGRSGRQAAGWAAAAGLLLGLAALFSYSAPWLGWSVVLTYFVRRRPWLNVVSGAAALVPLWGFWLVGFGWAGGLGAAQADVSSSIGPYRSWGAWVPLDLLVVTVVTGPAVAAAARKVRRTPGWPFVVGAVLGIGFAVLSGLSRGEVERAFLVFLPWLLVPAVAPQERPRTPGRPDSSPTPLLLLGGSALVGLVVETVLRSPW